MQCAGPHVRPSTYRDILQTDVPTGLPNVGPIVYEWSSCKITCGFLLNFALMLPNEAIEKLKK